VRDCCFVGLVERLTPKQLHAANRTLQPAISILRGLLSSPPSNSNIPSAIFPYTLNSVSSRVQLDPAEQFITQTQTIAPVINHYDPKTIPTNKFSLEEVIDPYHPNINMSNLHTHSLSITQPWSITGSTLTT